MLHDPSMPASVAQIDGAEETAEALPIGDRSPRRRISPPPIAHLAEKKKLIPFGWYGGKFSHLDWLLPCAGMSSLLRAVCRFRRVCSIETRRGGDLQ